MKSRKASRLVFFLSIFIFEDFVMSENLLIYIIERARKIKKEKNKKMRTVGLGIQQLARTENILFRKENSSFVEHRYDVVSVSWLSVNTFGIRLIAKNGKSHSDRHFVNLLLCR